MDLRYSISNQPHDIDPRAIDVLNSMKDPGPVDIILILYDGCTDYLKKSIEYSKKGDMKEKNIYANKAGDIIFELDKALNFQVGGEIAENLRSLYVLMGRNIVDAVQNENSDGLEVVVNMLANLREGWAHVAETTKNIRGNPLEA